jgi:hypothetical protein
MRNDYLGLMIPGVTYLPEERYILRSRVVSSTYNRLSRVKFTHPEASSMCRDVYLFTTVSTYLLLNALVGYIYVLTGVLC